MFCSQPLRVAARAAVLRRATITGTRIPATASQRLMSSGHEVDIMDKKLYPKDYHPATYDEAIIPAGNWHDHNKMLQHKYNRQLFVGIVIFASTIYYMTICPEIDLVLPPKSIGVNPPNFTVHPPKDA